VEFIQCGIKKIMNMYQLPEHARGANF